MTESVRTRFAPSPTGYLHIGGARTALFNYLLARQAGGKFLVRVENTDQTRNIAGAEDKLLDDLLWLGLEWDEGPRVGGEHGPYHQSERLDAYAENARRLLEEGNAYYAFDTREQLDAMRLDAQQKKQNFRYPRPDSFPSESDAQKARDEGRPVIVRFKMPRDGIVVQDSILGEVTIGADRLDDFVIVKSDGWPTYHFAVVVDDEHMNITDVLRGQEHLMNTPNHIALQRALGYRTPQYAHLPIILNMDGSKMSKREKDKLVRQAAQAAMKAEAIGEERVRELAGCDSSTFAAWRKKKVQLDNAALGRLAAELTVELPEIDIHDFRVSGYLPEALVNFIALMGWSAGDDREKYSLDDLCRAFRVERIGKTNAKFDRAKLLSFNTDALAAAPLDRSAAAFRDFLEVNPESALVGQDETILRQLIGMNSGFRTFRDIEHKSAAIFAADEAIELDASAVKKVLLKGDGAGLAVLGALREPLNQLEPWSAEALEKLIREYGETHELGLGKVAQPLRVAVTGTTVSPTIFDTLMLLGKQRTLARIDRTLETVKGAQ